jgi:short-subunit dehydrogenase
LRDLADRLSRQHGIAARVVVADLSHAAAPAQVAEACERDGVAVDVLVNNAGFGQRGSFVRLPLERQLAQVQVNVTALTHLAGLFLPGMVRRKRGRVLNVASTAAFQPGPNMAVYYATKAYVLSLSVALSVELEGTGVTVTALCPGPTVTGFQEAAKMEDSRLFRMGAMTVEPVALAGYRGMLKGKPIVVPGWRNRALGVAAQVSPRYWTAKIAGWLHVLRGAT